MLRILKVDRNMRDNRDLNLWIMRIENNLDILEEIFMFFFNVKYKFIIWFNNYVWILDIYLVEVKKY